MPCNTPISSIPKDCDTTNIGGIKKLYLIPADLVSGITMTNGLVTAIGTLSGANFSEYAITKNSGNYVTAGAADLAAGSTLFPITVTVTIPKREAVKRNAIMQIAAGQRDLYLITLDANGLYNLIGYENQANLTATAGGSGTAKAEGSNYVLTFLAEEPQLEVYVDPTIIAALIS